MTGAQIGKTPRTNIHNGYKSENSTVLQFRVPNDPQTALFEKLNAVDREYLTLTSFINVNLAVLDYQKRLDIRNELLEMGASVGNLTVPSPYDIGSQFETFSSRIGHVRSQSRKKTRGSTSQQEPNQPSSSYQATDDTTTNADQFSDCSSTVYSTQYDGHTEDGLDDDDEHAGMNYQMLLHYTGTPVNKDTDPNFQQSKFRIGN